MRLQPDSFFMAALLTALVAVAPISTDMYLPALPAIADHFSVTDGDVQLTLSIYLIGFGVGQLIFGPLSDRFGRRPTLIGGLVLFLVTSIVCLMSTNIHMLITARFFQAIGASAGGAVGRAVVRDIHGPKDAARMLAHMGSAMATAPLIAPLIGGQLTANFGWQSNFLTLAAVAIALLLLTVVMLPESHGQPDRDAISPKRMGANYAALAQHTDFRQFALTNAFSFAGLFAFISGSSFVLIDDLGLSPETFGFAFAIAVLGYMSGTQTAARIVHRTSLERLIGIGGRIGLAAGGLGVGLALLAPPNLAAVMVPMFFYNFSVGFVMPNSMAGAIAPFPHKAGAASALLGFVQMAVASAVGILVGQLHDGSALPMMALIATTGTVAFILALRIEARGKLEPISSQK